MGARQSALPATRSVPTATRRVCALQTGEFVALMNIFPYQRLAASVSPNTSTIQERVKVAQKDVIYVKVLRRVVVSVLISTYC